MSRGSSGQNCSDHHNKHEKDGNTRDEQVKQGQISPADALAFTRNYLSDPRTVVVVLVDAKIATFAMKWVVHFERAADFAVVIWLVFFSEF